jgi:glycosyltransferase involved in cell wall biosynthesis
MKVLHISYSDAFDGASIAAYRLHKSLREKGIDSRLIVMKKNTNDKDVICISNQYRNILRRVVGYAIIKKYKKRDKSRLFSPACIPFRGIRTIVNKEKPDIVHLHWICGGMLSLGQLQKIGRKAPLVFTMHDNWLYSGGCHVHLQCNNYKTKCGNCPILNSKYSNDLSSKIFIKKAQVFLAIKKYSIIGVSSWISNDAKLSPILNKENIKTVANPINIGVFKPVNKAEAREKLKLPENKKLILFGAVNPLSDKNKGYDILTKVLGILHNKELELVIFGNKQRVDNINGYTVHTMGFITDVQLLCEIYSACDVMLVPSYQEAFGQTAVESMACGTPVVAFGYSGLLDIIDHKINGYLAKPYDAIDFANGITWVINNTSHFELSKNARKKVENEFAETIVANKIISIYNDCLIKYKENIYEK